MRKTYQSPSAVITTTWSEALMAASGGSESPDNITIDIDNETEYDQTFHAKPVYLWDTDEPGDDF